MTSICSCGDPSPHIVARRTTIDGRIVVCWDDGAITTPLGRGIEGVPIARARTPDTILLARLAGALFMGEVALYGLGELGELYRACRWAAERDGLHGTVRARLARESPTLKPRWVVAMTDQQGRATERSWVLPRVRWPGVVVVDHPLEAGGRYVIVRRANGLEGADTWKKEARFRTIANLVKYLMEVKP